MSELPKCPVCGKPATRFARDMYRKANWETGTYEHTPVPLVKFGCDEHAPQSEVFDTSTYPPGPNFTESE